MYYYPTLTVLCLLLRAQLNLPKRDANINSKESSFSSCTTEELSKLLSNRNKMEKAIELVAAQQSKTSHQFINTVLHWAIHKPINYNNKNQVVLTQHNSVEPDIDFDTLPNSEKHKYYFIKNHHSNSRRKILPLLPNNNLQKEDEPLIDSTLDPMEKPKFGLNMPLPSRNFQPPIEAMIKLEFNNKIREVFINVRPMMSVFEALKQAEYKFQKKLKLPYDEELITFWPSTEFGCIIVGKISTIKSNKSMVWNVIVTNIDGEIEYSDTCVPPIEELFVKPGSTVNLIYTNVDVVNT